MCPVWDHGVCKGSLGQHIISMKRPPEYCFWRAFNKFAAATQQQQRQWLQAGLQAHDFKSKLLLIAMACAVSGALFFNITV